MKKFKGLKFCYKCGGRGIIGIIFDGEFLPQCLCKKCKGTGYL